MKKRLIFIFFMSISILINTIPLFVFKHSIAFSMLSRFPLIVMILVSVNGILSYFFRHKRNFLHFGTPRGSIVVTNKDYIFSKEYIREFYWNFIVYCFAIPFYIPCIFFSTKPIHSLWTLCVLSAPQIVFIVYGIMNTLKDVKEDKLKKEQLAKERLEQERREELGKWK